ncbi:MAG TPA: LysR family transcriptional regulator [Acidimicrobiales bacterium]|nr:LysR family transcriptional regulator [Acidimicrobiales bacterium]
MELRELEAFVAVATELHFGRAAARLHVGTPTLSELIRRLERELGTTLFTRTTRRVTLTASGAELLMRARTILDEVAMARAAVRRIGAGEGGVVRVGITPPVAPTLAPHLMKAFTDKAPNVSVELRRMWLPDLVRALADGRIDVAITSGLVDDGPGIVNEVFCAEPLLVGLRPNHRFAFEATIKLDNLADDVLGLAPPDLFPAWALAQHQALNWAGIEPPTVLLHETDLAAARWMDQPDVDWILLVPSLASAHTGTVIRPVVPLQLVPFTLQWKPSRTNTSAVGRLVSTALEMDLPEGWYRPPGHSKHG